MTRHFTRVTPEGVAVLPFHLRYSLTRRQRIGELLPWLPAMAGSIGFGIGIAYLAYLVSPVCLGLLLLPIVFYPGLFALLFKLTFQPRQPVDLIVDETTLTLITPDGRREFTLDGIIQVFRAGDVWTVLHYNRASLLIPVEAITEPQINYLKAFALRALAERKAADRRD